MKKIILILTTMSLLTSCMKSLEVYTVTVESNDVALGVASGGGTYTAGSTAVLTASPYQGCKFVKWVGTGSSTKNPMEVTVNSNMSYTAVFEETKTYTITVVSDDPNMGTVSGGGTYTQGATATLRAHPKTNYQFSQWQDGNKQNPRTITVNGNKTYTAYFTSTGGSGTTRTINDVVGTYSATVYNWDDNQWENWSGMTIGRINESLDGFTEPVLVENFDGKSFLLAVGDWDQSNQCVRLKAVWGMPSRTFVFTDNPDTNYYARFYPVYAENGGTNAFYLIQYSNGDDAEVLLKYNSSGQLVLTAAEQADMNGRYANGFSWKIYCADNDSDYGRYYIFTNLTMTKASSKTALTSSHVSKVHGAITSSIINTLKRTNNSAK